MPTLTATIEALLFASGKPLSLEELIRIVGAPKIDVTSALEELIKRYENQDGGLRLILEGERAALVTASSCSEIVKKFLHAEAAGELTRPALETLAVVCYRGPVARSEIEQIRGVNCTLMLRTLLMRGLIEEQMSETGESKYRVTHETLEHIGCTTLSALPEYEALRHHPELEKTLIELDKCETSTGN